jgi:hypothetical protein
MPSVNGLAIGSVYLLSDIAKAFSISLGSVKRMIPSEARRIIGGRAFALLDASIWAGITADPCRGKRAGFEEMRIDPLDELFESGCPPVVTEREAARLLGVGSDRRVRALREANLIEGAWIRGASYISTASLRAYAKSRTTGEPQEGSDSIEHVQRSGEAVPA